MDTKILIKNIINTYNPDIDTSEGSGVTDILIKPLSSVLQHYLDVMGVFQSYAELKDPATMSADTLDGIGQNFFITRITGVTSVGTVRILFERPRNLTLGAGTIFVSDKGILFRSIREYSITANQMSVNLYGTYYSTGPINVESTEVGEGQQVDAGAINQIQSSSFEFVRVLNDLPTSVSSADESNLDYYNRILRAATADSAHSPASIENTLRKHYIFKNCTVKGFGDPEMLRGISYEGTSTYHKVTSDFFGKRRAVTAYPHNPNFAGTTVNSTSVPPDLTVTSLNEMSNINYEALYEKNDSLKSESLSLNLLNEAFDENALDSWVLSDGNVGKGYLKEPEEITLSAGVVKLGITEVTKPEINVNLSRAALISLRDNLVEVINNLGPAISAAIRKIELDGGK